MPLAAPTVTTARSRVRTSPATLLPILLPILLLGLLPALSGCAQTQGARLFPLRLLPGADLKESIQRFAEEHDLEAAFVAACAGSLTRCALRFADQQEATVLDGKFEIVSLSGTVSRHGSHLHLCAARPDGRTIGGHLLAGATVYTTAEIVLGAMPDYVFTREQDGSTPWRELQIRRRP